MAVPIHFERGNDMLVFKRFVCVLLSLLLLSVFPLTALAAPAVPTVAEYVFSTLLSANGLDVPLTSVNSWLGKWSDYNDYLEQGERGNLAVTASTCMTCPIMLKRKP